MQEHKRYKRLGVATSARIKQASYPQLLQGLFLAGYLRVLEGILLAIALIIPVLRILSLIILVLLSEVYLFDRIHTEYTKSHHERSLFDESGEARFDFEEAKRKRDALSRSRQWDFTR